MVGRAKEAAKSPIVIGGVVVGGRQMLGQGEDGKEAPKLSPPRNFHSGGGGNLEKLVQIIAEATGKDAGGQVNMMDEEQLKELDLSPETIDNLRKEIQKLAGDRGWQLKMVELPGNNRELVGIIDDDGEDETDVEGRGKTADEIGDGEDDGQGSEEKFFKEEL
ncbi:hypothetical protein O1611_g7427 [Lasiodiplodia mahajangana]|uniref:Uncharacterized protein n=1 Tax=Lasiodiplodia mahajangana TaxID=1108764 RepID=A0ACC2JFL5_9PEZI|nr:hypothetical protein O1611_g7427 [Lasiodiplodia mahajangana]